MARNKLTQKTLLNAEKKNKKDGGNNMRNINTMNTGNVVNTKGSYNSYDNSYDNSYGYQAKSYSTPTESSRDDHLLFVGHKQAVLNKIQEKCLPIAHGSEFQFHFRALQIKIKNDKNEVVVLTFPTVYFNFPQKVTTGSVDFNLVEVNQVSEQIKPLSMEIAKKIIKAFPKKLFTDKGYEVKFVEGEVGSIHRHPGRFGFSGTDLRNNPLNPGVIFRVKEAQDLHQVDSVLYCDKDAELFTTECRYFNIQQVDPTNEDKGAVGTVEEIPTMVGLLQDKEFVVPSNRFKAFFGQETQRISKLLVKKFRIQDSVPELEIIMQAILESYEPQDMVIPENIENSFYGYGMYSGYDYESYGSKNSKDLLSYGFGAFGGKDANRKESISIATNLQGQTEKDFLEEIKEVLQLRSIYDINQMELFDLIEKFPGDLKRLYNKYKPKKSGKIKITIKNISLKMHPVGAALFISGNHQYHSIQWANVIETEAAYEDQEDLEVRVEIADETRDTLTYDESGNLLIIDKDFYNEIRNFMKDGKDSVLRKVYQELIQGFDEIAFKIHEDPSDVLGILIDDIGILSEKDNFEIEWNPVI